MNSSSNKFTQSTVKNTGLERLIKKSTKIHTMEIMNSL